MLNNILFEIPQVFEAGITSGSLTRIGTLIKDTSTGQIVAHVRETGIGQQLISQFAGSPFSPLGLVNAGSSLYANHQLSQLKHLVEGLQMLQYANLGVAMAGVGVGVVGFVVINKKLKSIEQSIAQLSEKVDQHFRDLFERQLRNDLSRIKGQLERIDVARTLTNSRTELIAASSSLTEASAVLRGEMEYRLALDTFDQALFTLLTRTLLLSDSARVEALMLADEPDSAHRTASLIAENYIELFDELNPFDLSRKEQIRHDLAQGVAERRTVSTHVLVKGLHDITDAAITRPYLIETLEYQKIKGSDFIAQLRNEKEHPLMLLLCNS